MVEGGSTTILRLFYNKFEGKISHGLVCKKSLKL